MSITDEEAISDIYEWLNNGSFNKDDQIPIPTAALSHLLTLAERGRDRPIEELKNVADGSYIVYSTSDALTSGYWSAEREQIELGNQVLLYRRDITEHDTFRLIQGEES